jgi:hypothetical protein
MCKLDLYKLLKFLKCLNIILNLISFYDFSLFSSNMHYNGANMSSMAAMHHGSSHNGSHGLSQQQQQQQQHESATAASHQHNASSGNNNNNGSGANSDSKTLSPPPSTGNSAGGYASYFGQLAANTVMDNVMCRPVH